MKRLLTYLFLVLGLVLVIYNVALAQSSLPESDRMVYTDKEGFLVFISPNKNKFNKLIIYEPSNRGKGYKAKKDGRPCFYIFEVQTYDGEQIAVLFYNEHQDFVSDNNCTNEIYQISSEPPNSISYTVGINEGGGVPFGKRWDSDYDRAFVIVVNKNAKSLCVKQPSTKGVVKVCYNLKKAQSKLSSIVNSRLKAIKAREEEKKKKPTKTQQVAKKEINKKIFSSIPERTGENFINSPELSHLEKIKKIKKSKKANMFGQIYEGQKRLGMQHGFGILTFPEGNMFIGKFRMGAMRDGTWIINGTVSTETYEYDEKGKIKKNEDGQPITHKTKFKPASQDEIEYIKTNVFLKNKISFEEYLKLKGKDKLLAKKENKKENNTNEYKSTGFNIYQGELQNDGKTFPYVEAYYENDCIKHGNVKYYDKDTSKPLISIFGFFENCKVDAPLSKVSHVYFDKDLKQKYLYNSVFKKDVSHIYGNRPVLGIKVSNVVNQIGVNVGEIQKDRPITKSSIKKGDLIISVNGRKIISTGQFVQTIRETNKGETLFIKYVPKKYLDKDFKYQNDKIKEAKVKPEYIEEKVALQIVHFLKDDFYEEYIKYENGATTIPWDIVPLTPDSKEWKNRQSILKNEFNSLKKYYLSFIGVKTLKNHDYDYEQYYVVSNKKVDSANVSEQELVQLEENKDTKPPVIKVAENITVKRSSYKITGEVEDDSKKMIYIEVDGIVSATNDGKFTLNRFSPVDEQVSIVAIDQWGNRSEPSIVNVKIDTIKKVAKKIEKLNPSLINTESNQNRVALIIGIEKYKKAPNANFANLDAKYFYEYAKNGFGISEPNIKLLTDQEANLIESLGALSKWLPSKVVKNQTEIIIFFAGHGLASTDGKELFLLPNDGDTDLLARTGLSRTEIFDAIVKLKPKSVTMFLDTCYSGVSRDEEMLLASARPIRIVADEQKNIPKNFTIFTASKLDQISSGLKEAKHGIFSYFLMKGLEGKADSDNDKKITNGELLAYMDINISQKALELGRQQNPSLAGNPDQVLMRY
jgi:hypothetical protein